MAVRVCLVLGVLAAMTAGQLPRWRSDVALWQAASAISMSPRASLNLAIAYRKAGRIEGAIIALHETDARSRHHPDRARYRQAITNQIGYLELMGVEPCVSPSLQPLCSP